jgi:transcription factor TFIIIB component B''
VLVVEQIHHQSTRRSRSASLATTSPKKPRKAWRPETPAFDADADPGEELDPTSVTMAALCEDTGQGRISSKAAQILDNHLAWKKSNKEKRVRMRVRMEAKKYGRNEDDDTAQVRCPEAESERTPAPDVTLGPPSIQPISGHPSNVEDTSGQGFDYSQNVATSRYNVQVRIGPNGETIVDEESLFVDRNAEGDTTEYTHVEESDVTKFINSGTYSKRFRGSRWSAEETELFYDVSLFRVLPVLS